VSKTRNQLHVNIQRRLSDDQFAWARTPGALAQRHRACIQTVHTPAPQGLRNDQRLPPMPVEVLGTAQGRTYAPDARAETFANACFPRTTNRSGCVTWHRYHCSVAAGLPQTPIFLWIYGEQWRAVCDHGV
jgi:hypothetical protein